MKLTDNLRRETEWGLCAVFCAAPFLLALFHEWLSALAAAVLAGMAAAAGWRGKKLTVPVRPMTAAVLLLPIAYAVSSFGAADRGMAWFGVLKFLPLPLFCLLLAQVLLAQASGPASATAAAPASDTVRKKLLRTVPWTAAVMTVLSGALSFLPSLAPLYLVNGRLAGFFQYPNAYAAYAAAGTVLILTREEERGKLDLIPLPVLLLGIAWSGCRAVMILTAAAMILCAVTAPSGKRRAECLTAAVLAFGAAALVLLARNGWEISALFGSLTRRSSTVYGRLLYDLDALPVIAKHPLGLGYLGYAFRQGSFQTGVYTVTHVHNDYFQLLLDAGWLPFAVCLWAVIAGLRRADRGSRIAASVLLAHALVDFDLQFVAMDFLLILLLTPENEGKPGRGSVTLGKPAVLTCACLVCAFSLWLGASSFLHYIGREDAALRVYPRHTQAAMNLMRDADGPEARAEYAGRILTWNDSCAQAYRVMARSAFAEGRIEAMARYAEAGIACSRFELAGYLDYFDMLFYALGLCRQAGDQTGEAWCRARLEAIPEMLREVKASASPLAWKLTDQPELDLPEEYELRLKNL